MADQPTMPDPSKLVERAVESVLDQVPDIPDFSIPEAKARIQPWADVAIPAGKNKRPLEELLADFEARVAAAPDAKAELPKDRHPAELFFERLERGPGSGERSGSGRRRRRRGGRRQGAEGQAQSAGPRSSGQGQRPSRPPQTRAPGSGEGQTADPNRRRRRRRGRRGRGGQSGGSSTAPAE